MAASVLDTLTQDRTAQIAYISRMKFELDREFSLRTAEQEGLERGLERGHAEGKTTERNRIAQKMLQRGNPIEIIAEDTGLSIEEINKLQKEV